jgi:16S rRNA (cytidine1402-2'-O)-methyltransferase
VAFESPRRLPRSLARLARSDPDRRVAVCRELTKLHEEVVRGTAAELAARYAAATVKGEVTLVVAPGELPSAGVEDAVVAVVELVSAGATRRAAVDVVSRLSHVPRNALYSSSLDAARRPD